MCIICLYFEKYMHVADLYLCIKTEYGGIHRRGHHSRSPSGGYCKPAKRRLFGEQSKVLWVVVNRIFTDDNLTHGRSQTLENVLQYGDFESLTSNNPNGTYNAFHPDYNSEGWANAKFLAALLYALVENEKKENLDEDYIRETLSNFQDLQGNYITNEIGDCDSFWGDGRINHFYIYSEGRNNE